MRLSVTSPPEGRGAQPPASLRGTMENGPTGQMRSSNPPPGCGGVAPGSANLGLGLTSRKGALCPTGGVQSAPFLTWANVALPHGKAHSGPRPQSTPHGKAHFGRRNRRISPKDALWLRRHLQNASLREASYEKTHSGRSGARKMRFSVTSNSRMRFSVECAFSHLGKRGAGSRKSALCNLRLTEKRILPKLLTKRRILA